MKNLTILLLLPLVLFIVGCQSENIIEESMFPTSGVCKLVMNAKIESFDGKPTRAGEASVWKDGDCVYLSFVRDGNAVKGRAIYDADDNDWTLYYDGILTNGTYKGKAAYIEGVSDNTSNIRLSHRNSVFADEDIVCEKTSEMLMVNATLRPQTGRIRFWGEPGMDFDVSGVWCYNGLDVNECSLSKDESTLFVKINNDGYSDYVYCSFPQLSRSLSVAYGNHSFMTICEHPILDAGQSGYMSLPTETRHNGWEMTVITLPVLSSVTTSCVEDQGTVTFTAEVLSAGNGSVTDCGFVYSKIENPTISDGKVSCGNKEQFSATINDLTVGEKYYVRAYAINQVGTAYSEQTSFIAGGGRPKDDDLNRPVLVRRR